MKIIDGAAFINTNPPKHSNTFKDYCAEMNMKLEKIAGNTQRTDVVFDTYRKKQLENSNQRGS